MNDRYESIETWNEQPRGRVNPNPKPLTVTPAKIGEETMKVRACKF